MRYYKKFNGGTTEEEVAEIAKNHAEMGVDNYSEHGVGAALVVNIEVDEFAVYAGSNFNLSGFQTKVHAEQLACFQLLLDMHSYIYNDIDIEMRTLMVNTTEDDGAFRCGHCLQVVSAVCRHLGQSRDNLHYSGARKLDGQWHIEGYPLSYLLPESYIDKRSHGT